MRRRADIVFPRLKLAVFVDGCFWHGCPMHGTLPKKTNRAWWKAKIEGNQRRDEDTNRQLTDAGWTVLRFWEHEAAEDAARTVLATVSRLRRDA